MLVPETGPSTSNNVLIKFISPEGLTMVCYFSGDILIEEIKNRALDYFYPNGESGSSRYKIVRVNDFVTLHDFLTLNQEQIYDQEELMLIERITPDPGTFLDLGTIRAPQQATIAAVTAQLQSPQNTVVQPNLLSLLSTNELTYELKKILISLIEAGARLAAAGRNYQMTLKQLSNALDGPQASVLIGDEIITPEEIAFKLQQIDTMKRRNTPEIKINESSTESRVEHLQRFLDKFYEWRIKVAESPTSESIRELVDLGFDSEEAEKALKYTGCNVPAAASYLIGERSSSVFEMVNGLPDGVILQSLLKQPQIQRGLLNTRMLIAFITIVAQGGSANLWFHSPHGSPLLSQISRTYHSEKYCLAVNQFSSTNTNNPPVFPQKPTTSNN